jgi:hypothetical protein
MNINKNMKRATVIALIVVGVLVLGAVVVGVLNALVGGGKWTFGWSDYHYDDSAYAVGDGTVYATELTEISVDWIDGNVHIVVCDDDYPSLTERASELLTDDSRMRYLVSEDGKTLSVKYRKSSSFFGMSENKNKDLTLRIPRKMFSQLTLVDIYVRSSRLTVEGIDVKNLSIRSEKGDVELLLAPDAGFVLTSEMRDGKTPTVDFAVEQKDGAYVCGDGRSCINVKADRGSVSVKKMK